MLSKKVFSYKLNFNEAQQKLSQQKLQIVVKDQKELEWFPTGGLGEFESINESLK